MYSKRCQTSQKNQQRLGLFLPKKNMFLRLLHMPLDYLSCFAVVLRGTHRKYDICKTHCGIHTKLNIFSYSEVKHGNITFKLKKGQLLNLIIFFFFFLLQAVSAIKRKWRVLFFTRLKLVACVLACGHVIACIK